MPFNKTDIPGLVLFQPKVFEDSRGYFFESFNKAVFAAEGLAFDWVQDNESYSGYGVIRGLHFQNHPKAQAKLIRVLEGKIYDVAVDIREGSPTFGKWFYGAFFRKQIAIINSQRFCTWFSVIRKLLKCCINAIIYMTRMRREVLCIMMQI